MKQLIFAVLAIGASLLSRAQDDSRDLYLTKTFNDGSFTKIHSVCTHGDIEVVNAAGTEAKVEVFVRKNGNGAFLSKEEIRHLLDEYYVLDISVNGGELTAAIRDRKTFFTGNRPISISLKIYAGKDKSGEIETSHGNLRMAGFNGSEKLRTDHGDISAENISGELNARTSHGNIVIAGAGKQIDAQTDHGDVQIRESAGTARLATSNGNITIRDFRGKARAETDHGDVSADMVTAGIMASTSHGNIDLNRISGALAASTDHGDLNIQIEKLTGDAELKNSGGNISLEVPKASGMDIDLRGREVVVNSMSNFQGTKENEHINGTLNGGGIKVVARTDRGQVDLTFR